MVLSTFQSQTKLQKCFLLNIIELGGLKIAINNAMPKYDFAYIRFVILINLISFKNIS